MSSNNNINSITAVIIQHHIQVAIQGMRLGRKVFTEQQEIVDPWRQPFPQIKPFRNGMAATSSFFAKQTLNSYHGFNINKSSRGLGGA